MKQAQMASGGIVRGIYRRLVRVVTRGALMQACSSLVLYSILYLRTRLFAIKAG